MSVTFIPVNEDNIQAVSRLHIKKSQDGMVETVMECYKEARELALWRPTAIAYGASLIGFAMYGLFLDEDANGRVWLDRFFIDERYQGRGFGRLALALLLKRITEEYRRPAIYLSVYENNPVAIHLYESFGFRFNGEIDRNGEKVMVKGNSHHSSFF